MVMPLTPTFSAVIGGEFQFLRKRAAFFVKMLQQNTHCWTKVGPTEANVVNHAACVALDGLFNELAKAVFGHVYTVPIPINFHDTNPSIVKFPERALSSRSRIA